MSDTSVMCVCGARVTFSYEETFARDIRCAACGKLHQLRRMRSEESIRDNKQTFRD